MWEFDFELQQNKIHVQHTGNLETRMGPGYHWVQFNNNYCLTLGGSYYHLVAMATAFLPKLCEVSRKPNDVRCETKDRSTTSVNINLWIYKCINILYIYKHLSNHLLYIWICLWTKMNTNIFYAFLNRCTVNLHMNPIPFWREVSINFWYAFCECAGVFQ